MSTEAEIAKIQQQKRLVEAQKANNIVYFDAVQLVDYIKSDQPPNIDINAFRVRSAQMMVVDKNQECVGRIEDNQFKFYKFYAGVC